MIRSAILAACLLLAMPALAQEACSRWTAEMVEDEGGPVLTAEACAIDRPDAYLSLSCFGGSINLRHDLSLGAERSADLDETANVRFTVDGMVTTIPMQYEDMDGRHAVDLAPTDPLLDAIASGTTLSIVDDQGRYPEHRFSLAGSSAAIATLRKGCR